MLADYVTKYRSVRVLVIGDAMLDIYLEGRATRICSEGPVPVIQKTSEESIPGGGANTAANLAVLGANVRFVSIVGEDQPGGVLLDRLMSQGITCRHVVKDGEASTVQKMRIVAAEQYLVRFDQGDRGSWSADARRKTISCMEAAFDECDVVVISDYGYGVVTDELLERLKVLRQKRHVPLCIDAKDVRRYARAGATVITPNHTEAFRAVGQELTCDEADLASVRTAAERLLMLLDVEQVVITMAGQGAYLLDRNGADSHVAARRPTEVHDVGAGDSFLSALSLSLAVGASLEESTQIGIEAARIAVSQPRTALVRHQDLMQAVSRAAHTLPPPLFVLEEDLAGHRAKGHVIVFTNGVFDILHAGHIDFLHQARGLGDVLVVGLNSDLSARRLKGRNRPVNPERDRAAILSALDCVDYVTLFDEDEPSRLIRRLKPAIHAKGGDYAGEALPEAEAVAEVGARIEILPLSGAVSTSAIIDRILRLEPEIAPLGVRR